MTERDNEAAYQRKVSEARRIVDDEMRWIMRENPKPNPELCAKLFYEEAKNDRKLAAAAMLAAAASISEDVVREQQARKRKFRRPWPLLRGLASSSAVLPTWAAPVLCSPWGVRPPSCAHAPSRRSS